MFAAWMPWKCIECGIAALFVKCTRIESPSVQRSVGPGTAPLNVQAAYRTPGATSISVLSASIQYSRRARPSFSRVTFPVSNSVSVRMACFLAASAMGSLVGEACADRWALERSGRSENMRAAASPRDRRAMMRDRGGDRRSRASGPRSPSSRPSLDGCSMCTRTHRNEAVSP